MAITWMIGGDSGNPALDIEAHGEITTTTYVETEGKSGVLFYFAGESGALRSPRGFGLGVNASDSGDPTDETGAYGAGINLGNSDGADGRALTVGGVVSISPIGPKFGAYSIRPVLRAGAAACESVSIGYEVFA